MAKRPPGVPKATRAMVAERRTRAIELRQAGVDPVTIGRQLRYGTWHQHPAPTDDDPDAVQWEQRSTDAVLSRMVRQDIDRGLADRRAGLATAADEHIRQSEERLERLRVAAWTEALKGSAPHIREARQIEAQLAQLNGWNKPVRHEVDLPSARAEVLEAVRELVALAATTDIDLELALPSGAEEATSR